MFTEENRVVPCPTCDAPPFVEVASNWSTGLMRVRCLECGKRSKWREYKLGSREAINNARERVAADWREMVSALH